MRSKQFDVDSESNCFFLHRDTHPMLKRQLEDADDNRIKKKQFFTNNGKHEKSD